MDYETFKRYELAKQIENIYNAVQDGTFDELLKKKYKHESNFENRTEITGILARMCSQLAENINQ